MRLTPDIFTSTIRLLNADKHTGVGESIELAKGKYYLPNSARKLYKLLKRELSWQKKLVSK